MKKVILKYDSAIRIISLYIISILIISCSTFGYSTGKYGAVVNCDADQPMDELLKCVNEKYAFMDKFHKSIWLKNSEKLARFGKRTYEKPSDYREIDQFVSIKKDDEYLRKNGYPPRQFRVDDYKDTKMRVLQIKGGVSIYFSRNDRREKFASGDFNRYSRSLRAISRDVLVTKSGKDNKAYTASYELVPINNNEFLFVIAIGNFCQKSATLELCGVNYVYFTGRMEPDLFIFDNPSEYPMAKNYWEKDLSDYTHEIITLSANKRENPTELYIKLNNRYFSLKLDKGEAHE